MKKHKLVSLFIFSFLLSTVLSAQTISTVAGNNAFGPGYSGDGGPATDAELFAPYGVAVDASGNLFISDEGSSVIRMVDHSTGNISTYAGIAAGNGYSGDGGAATAAELNVPTGISIDASGNLFIADASNNVIRKVDHTNGIISTVGGNNVSGYTGNGGPATAAELNSPTDVKFNLAGDMFIAEFSNQVIRKVDYTTNNISTVAGINTSGYSGDGGPATAAELNCPEGVAIDNSGNIFISEHNNNVIRRVDNVTGNISTYAGNQISGYSGDGGPAANAEISRPVGITTDRLGNIFFSDQNNVVIRKVDNAGKISTIAGNNAFGFGYSGDGGPATAAELKGADGIALDAMGNLFMGDAGNNVIREVTAVTIGIDELKIANEVTKEFVTSSPG